MREMEKDRTVKWKVDWSCNRLFTEALFSSFTVPAFKTCFDHSIRVELELNIPHKTHAVQLLCAGPGEL